jgi:hypothetical protein
VSFGRLWWPLVDVPTVCRVAARSETTPESLALGRYPVPAGRGRVASHSATDSGRFAANSGNPSFDRTASISANYGENGLAG